MSSPLAADPTAPSDAELIALVRGGDAHAYGTLFERHRESANRLARQLVSSADADDLVSEAFIKVLWVLKDGGGPDIAFRPYLLTAVRRLHVDRIRSNSKVTPSDEMDRFDPGVPRRPCCRQLREQCRCQGLRQPPRALADGALAP